MVEVDEKRHGISLSAVVHLQPYAPCYATTCLSKVEPTFYFWRHFHVSAVTRRIHTLQLMKFCDVLRREEVNIKTGMALKPSGSSRGDPDIWNGEVRKGAWSRKVSKAEFEDHIFMMWHHMFTRVCSLTRGHMKRWKHLFQLDQLAFTLRIPLDCEHSWYR